MRHLLARYTRRFAALLCLAITVEAALPALQVTSPFPLVQSALADDDDDDGGGGDGGGGRSGGGSGWDGGGRGGRDLRGDLRRLFRWPWQESRRAPRREARVPDRAPNEIVAAGLSETSIASLTQNGFQVDDRLPVGLTGGELVRLVIPQGMALEAARQAVVSEAPGASVDFNHFYQPEQANSAPCAESGCALVRNMVGWPAVEVGSACAAPQRIGLIDTAINADHASLSSARIEVLRLSEEALPRSGEQHGTAVAALLVGASGSRAPGLLPGSELVAIDAFRRFGSTADIADVYDLVRALDLMVGRGIRAVNLSLTGPSNLLLEQAVKAAIARGTILVAAAGNDGPNAEPVYPAAYEDVIAVTAVDRAKKPYRRAVRGVHIDIAAPGVGVWTAASISGARQKSGTSFAAPFVTAAAAVLIAARPKMTPQEVEKELMGSAEDMGAPGKDAIYGWGLLNARALCSG